jgi:hypothetical protein
MMATNEKRRPAGGDALNLDSDKVPDFSEILNDLRGTIFNQATQSFAEGKVFEGLRWMRAGHR